MSCDIHNLADALISCWDPKQNSQSVSRSSPMTCSIGPGLPYFSGDGVIAEGDRGDAPAVAADALGFMVFATDWKQSSPPIEFELHNSETGRLEVAVLSASGFESSWVLAERQKVKITGTVRGWFLETNHRFGNGDITNSVLTLRGTTNAASDPVKHPPIPSHKKGNSMTPPAHLNLKGSIYIYNPINEELKITVNGGGPPGGGEFHICPKADSSQGWSPGSIPVQRIAGAHGPDDKGRFRNDFDEKTLTSSPNLVEIITDTGATPLHIPVGPEFEDATEGSLYIIYNKDTGHVGYVLVVDGVVKKFVAPGDPNK